MVAEPGAVARGVEWERTVGRLGGGEYMVPTRGERRREGGPSVRRALPAAAVVAAHLRLFPALTVAAPDLARLQTRRVDRVAVPEGEGRSGATGEGRTGRTRRPGVLRVAVVAAAAAASSSAAERGCTAAVAVGGAEVVWVRPRST